MEGRCRAPSCLSVRAEHGAGPLEPTLQTADPAEPAASPGPPRGQVTRHLTYDTDTFRASHEPRISGGDGRGGPASTQRCTVVHLPGK